MSPGDEAQPSGVWDGPQLETLSLAGSGAGGGPGGPAGPAPGPTLRTTRARRKASTATRTWAEPGTVGEDSGHIEEQARPEVRGVRPLMSEPVFPGTSDGPDRKQPVYSSRPFARSRVLQGQPADARRRVLRRAGAPLIYARHGHGFSASQEAPLAGRARNRRPPRAGPPLQRRR